MMRGWGLGGGADDDDYHGHGGGGGGRGRARWTETYHCYSVAFADKAHLEVGFLLLLMLWWERRMRVWRVWHQTVPTESVVLGLATSTVFTQCWMCYIRTRSHLHML
jgi:hypothetical protein